MMKKSIIFACSMIFMLSVNAQTVVRSLGALVTPASNEQSTTKDVSTTTTTTSKTGQVEGVSSPNDNLSPMQKLQKEHSQGGLEIACNGWETVGMIDIAATGNWWYVAVAPTWGAKNEYIKENAGFRLGGGLHKRYHLTNWLYVDGRVGLHYGFTKMRTYDGEHTERVGVASPHNVTYKDYSDKKYHNGLFTFRPCIGFNLFQIRGSDFSIFGAYEGVVSFKGGDYGNSWSAGICIGF